MSSNTKGRLQKPDGGSIRGLGVNHSTSARRDVVSPTADARRLGSAGHEMTRDATEYPPISPSRHLPLSKSSPPTDKQKPLLNASTKERLSLPGTLPSRIASHPTVDSSESNSPTRLPSNSNSLLPQKRQSLVDDISGSESRKRAKDTFYSLQGDLSKCSYERSSPRSAQNIPQQIPTDSERLQIALSSLRDAEDALEEERNAHRMEKEQLARKYNEALRECEQVKQAEQAAVKKDEMLSAHIDELRDQLRHVERTCKDAMTRSSEMHVLLEAAESSKKQLQDTLDATERECQRLREKLLSNSPKATQKQHDSQNHVNGSGTAVQIAEDAPWLVEGHRKTAEERQISTEAELASERLRRIAVEQAFLDVQNIIRGV